MRACSLTWAIYCTTGYECKQHNDAWCLTAALTKQASGRALSYLEVRRGRSPAFYGSVRSTSPRYADWSQMVGVTRSFFPDWRCATRTTSVRGHTWAERIGLWVRHRAVAPTAVPRLDFGRCSSAALVFSARSPRCCSRSASASTPPNRCSRMCTTTTRRTKNCCGLTAPTAMRQRTAHMVTTRRLRGPP